MKRIPEALMILAIGAMIVFLACAAYGEDPADAASFSVGVVWTHGQGGGSKGTYVCIKRTGRTYYALTNKHLTEGVRTYEIAPSGHAEAHAGTLVYSSPVVDAAVLSFQCDHGHDVIAFAEQAKTGEWCASVGFAGPSRQASKRSGILTESTPTRLATSFTVVPGESGSVLVDSRGYLIGLIAGYTGQYGAPQTQRAFGISLPALKQIKNCDWGIPSPST